MHDLAPQTGRFQNVRLVDGNDLFLTFLSEFESDLRDARDLFHVIFFRIVGVFAAFALASAALAEIDAARQFAHDHQIDALCRDIRA